MNEMQLKFMARSENEEFARNVVAAFSLSLNPSLAELSDIKTAVSEAVTNSIVRHLPAPCAAIPPPAGRSPACPLAERR